MWMMYVIWALIALPLVGLTMWVYRLAARKNRVFAAALAAGVLTMSILIWPIPIHGGFTFVAEMIHHEWRTHARQREHTRVEHEQQKFISERSSRFADVLEYAVQRPLAHGWSEVMTASGEQAWFNATHKLVWSAVLPLALSVDRPGTLPPLAMAKARCQQLSPTGQWALASDAEQVLWWQSKGDEVLGKSPFSMVSYIEDDDARIELPVYALKKHSSTDQAGNRAAFAVRCVARTPETPAGGYNKRDVSLELWNAYQLSKMAP